MGSVCLGHMESPRHIAHMGHVRRARGRVGASLGLTHSEGREWRELVVDKHTVAGSSRFCGNSLE